MGGSGESYGASGIAAAKTSGMCQGAGDMELCAELYRLSVRDGLDRAQGGS